MTSGGPDKRQRGRPAIVSRPTFLATIVIKVERELALMARAGRRANVSAACRALMLQRDHDRTAMRLVFFLSETSRTAYADSKRQHPRAPAHRDYEITSWNQLRKLYYAGLAWLESEPDSDAARWTDSQRRALQTLTTEPASNLRTTRAR